MKKFTSLFLLLIICTTLSLAQSPKEGLWKGTIIYSNAEIPFNFEVDYPDNSSSPTLIFINGEDRAPLQASIKGDSLIIPMFAFDITLKMKMGQELMSGSVTKHYSNRRYEFIGEFGKSRYDIENEISPILVGERWDMTINPDKSSEYPAVGLFKQDGNRITGTILTKVSEYRFFEGIVKGNSIEMSTFDGVHSFLLRGTFNEESQNWSGELVLDDGYSRPWTAVQDDNAELPNPFEMVDLTGQNIRPEFEKIAALSEQVIQQQDYQGKPLIIQLMGTWCSNSQDQSRYLVNWVAKNAHKGVQFLAVNYEANYSEEYAKARMATYNERLNLPYPLILGGPLSKRKAAEAFPFMDEIEAFPTLVFIDKDGFARYVSSYFTGPATGEYYENFDQRFNAIVDELLSN